MPRVPAANLGAHLFRSFRNTPPYRLLGRSTSLKCRRVDRCLESDHCGGRAADLTYLKGIEFWSLNIVANFELIRLRQSYP